MAAKYTFDPKIAKYYGVDEAIMFENIYFWVQKNETNNKHFYDGNYWTYNSIQAFCKQFPFWTNRQIDRILKSLEKKGAIITGNYNKSSYDRTKWYAITETAKSIYVFGEMDITKTLNDISPNGEINLPESSNGITQNDKPIPYINTYKKQDVNQITTTNKENLEQNSSSSDEKEFKNLKLYEELGFGSVNSTSAKNIKDLEEQYSEAWVEKALLEADYKGKRSLDYVQGILKNWKVTGITKEKDKIKESKPSNKPTNERYNSQMYEEYKPSDEPYDYEKVYRETCERMRKKKQEEQNKK